MTREEHLEWAKARALEYVDMDDLPQAFASLTSDLSKHEQLEDHPAIHLGMGMMMLGHLDTSEKMRRFILGCH